MLLFGSWLVLIGFWFYALRLALLDSRWLAFGFICLWTIARFGFPLVGSEGPSYFLAFAAMLTAIMVFVDLYRSNMGLRNPPPSPLQEIDQLADPQENDHAS